MAAIDGVTAVSLPPQDDEHIEILSSSGNSLKVKRKTLMLSHVFRDAFDMSDRRSSSTTGTVDITHRAAPLKIDASTDGLKWLFGLIEGVSVLDLIPPVAKGRERSQPPSPQPIHEARALADKYDIWLYDAVLSQALFILASEGKYSAVTALGLGFHMPNEPLYRISVQKLEGMPAPPKMGWNIIKTMGPVAAWSITNAYSRCRGFCTCFNLCYSSQECKNCKGLMWADTTLQWLELAKLMQFVDFSSLELDNSPLGTFANAYLIAERNDNKWHRKRITA